MTTSYYTSYFDWIPDNIIELKYGTMKVKKSHMNCLK